MSLCRVLGGWLLSRLPHLPFEDPQGRLRRDQGQGMMFAFWTVALLGPVGHEVAFRLWGSGRREVAKNL